MPDYLLFEKRHNIVAEFYETLPKATEYLPMIQFLKRSRVYYALTVNPVIYRDLVNAFWRTAEVGLDTGPPSIRATVAGVEITISEDLIRRVLGFNDAANDRVQFPSDLLKGCFARMGYAGDLVVSEDFNKGNLPPLWRFLVHTLIFCMSSRKGGFDSCNAQLQSAIVALVLNKRFNFSRYIFNALQTNIKERNKRFIMYPRFIQLLLDELAPTLPKTGVKLKPNTMQTRVFKDCELYKNRPSVSETQLFGHVVNENYVEPENDGWYNPDEKENRETAEEKENLCNSEKTPDSVREELGSVEQSAIIANEKVKTQNDMYKSLQEYNTSLQQYNTKLQDELKTANDANKQLEKEKAAILEKHVTLRGQHNVLQKEFTSAKDSRDDAFKQKEIAKKEVDILRAELQVREDRDRQLLHVQELNSQLNKYKENTGPSVVEETCSSQREEIYTFKCQLDAVTQKLKMADLSSSEIRTEYEEQKLVASELQERLRDAEKQLLEGESLRKKLHNTILELKGNIRVFCRVRPLLPDDGPGAEACVSYPASVDLAGRGIDLCQKGQKYPFTFDKVFAHDASQEEVFMEISELVQNALDGYKVCIFAYGQTGSGKTYTMMGRPETPVQKGLIPRSLEQVFQTSQALAAQGWRYKMQAYILEIYNETIRDLLSPRSSGWDGGGGGAGKQYVIRHDAAGNISVSDLTIVDVCSIREVSNLLQQAEHSRSVGKTDMNEHSSRSHLVFTLRIFGVNERTEQHVQGVLNLIDLAGSERLSKSGATGDRLKETQAINKSLSSLSDVIYALVKKEDHVPFRNTKLTYLLQPCLGGDSKTLMLVNVSPDASSFGESLNSLRFAARVNTCVIGVPHRQTTRPTHK